MHSFPDESFSLVDDRNLIFPSFLTLLHGPYEIATGVCLFMKWEVADAVA